MRPINQIVLTGVVGSDPEVRYTQAGKCVVGIPVYHTRSRKQGDEWVEENSTRWHVSWWGDDAAARCEGIVKGDLVQVVGRAEMRRYQTKDGGQAASADIIAETVAKIGRAQRQQVSQSSGGGWGTGGFSGQSPADEAPPS